MDLARAEDTAHLIITHMHQAIVPYIKFPGKPYNFTPSPGVIGYYYYYLDNFIMQMPMNAQNNDHEIGA